MPNPLRRVRGPVTTGTPIALLIDNEDQRSKDYADDQGPVPPRPRRLTPIEPKYGIRDYRGGGRASARETAARVAAGAIARKIARPRSRPRRARPDRPALDRPQPNGTGTRPTHNPFFCPDAGRHALGDYLDDDAQSRLFRRRRHRDRRRGRAPRLGRADLWQARRRTRRGDDVDQRRQGRRDRRRLRRRGPVGRGKRRRDAHRQRGQAGFLSNHAGGILGGISTGQASSRASRSSRPSRS